jgi:biopolymer transport protein ExbD
MSTSFTALNTQVEEDERPMNEINTTPLVDVMLVLLIVFMITIPVITHTVPLDLPQIRNQATQTKPENINLSVNKDGQVFWGTAVLSSNQELLDRLKGVATLQPQPEVHIRADQQTKYEHVGRVILDAQRAGMLKVGFITEPEPGVTR